MTEVLTLFALMESKCISSSHLPSILPIYFSTVCFHLTKPTFFLVVQTPRASKKSVVKSLYGEPSRDRIKPKETGHAVYRQMSLRSVGSVLCSS